MTHQCITYFIPVFHKLSIITCVDSKLIQPSPPPHRALTGSLSCQCHLNSTTLSNRCQNHFNSTIQSNRDSRRCKNHNCDFSHFHHQPVPFSFRSSLYELSPVGGLLAKVIRTEALSNLHMWTGPGQNFVVIFMIVVVIPTSS